jgi:glycosyltransferase involved in cell wall biosynthesis
VADIVAAENAPFIVPQGDEAALAAALVRLAGDEALRRRTGDANQLRARAEFDEGAMAARHGALYAAALGLPTFP